MCSNVQAGGAWELQVMAGGPRVQRVGRWLGSGMMMTQRGDLELKAVA